MRILVVEDDKEIQNLVAYFFTKEGYEVDLAADGLEGMRLLKKNQHKLIILDLMLPNLDGKNFTRIIRDMPEEYGNPKIIMLTAKTEIEDVLEGLSIGANDYMKKPFDPRELVLRGKKLLESYEERGEVKKSLVHVLDELTLDEEKRLIMNGLEEVELSKKEYELLLLLLKNRGLVLTREKILDFVWGTDYFSGDRSVDVYISKLREKIPMLSKYIKTIKGVGYRMEDKK